MSGLFELPVNAVLPALAARLAHGNAAVLIAPPGAGKTTRVPPFLLDAPWRADRKILLLEPRRLPARATADYMAHALGETLGATVGLRIRHESRISAATRLEVLTEGVFVRMVLDDPSLDAVAAIVFDEFHERSLDADFGLALALDVQSGLRPDLRIIVMSATLEGARVASLLNDAPVVETQGRAFPVETRYLGRDPRERLEDAVVKAALHALASESGSILIFLPGQAEIARVAGLLEAKIRDPSVEIAALYSALERGAQMRAIMPAVPGRRKIVLATSIAETSLTIEGVRIVIDCGLSRVPRYEPDLGLTRLETVRVSRAAADQRRGRAGRTEPGVCLRLWEEAATGALPAFAVPEIRAADLASLVLDCAAWGVRDPSALQWLDPPPKPALREATSLLQAIGAIDPDGRITEDGRAIRALALPPRIARMVVAAAESGDLRHAAEIAAVIVERGLGGDAADLETRLARFRADRGPRAEDARRLVATWIRLAQAAGSAGGAKTSGWHLARAFPDRIAKARGKPGAFLMANGRAAAVEPHDRLAGEGFLAVGEISGHASAARILLAAPLTLAEIETLAASEIEVVDQTAFDPERGGVRSRRQRRLGALVLGEQTLAVMPGPEVAETLARGVATSGLQSLPWTKPLQQWRARVAFLRAHAREADACEGTWPDLSDLHLQATAVEWLTPYLLDKTSLAEITPALLQQALEALLPWDLRRRLETEAPSHYATPAGSNIGLDYAAEGGPILSVRVQELYGLASHPALAAGRVPLTLELLSPAHRPIQITRDLPGFWRGSWASVKTEMKGRYPRHLWPDDPAAAQPTTRAKPRGS